MLANFCPHVLFQCLLLEGEPVFAVGAVVDITHHENTSPVSLLM